MDNYRKGKNVKAEATRQNVPIQGLPANCTWMKVRAGSKLRNLIGVADKALKEEGSVLFSGQGPALSKVITCAEIVKRKNRHCHQYNHMGVTIVEEHWDSKVEELDDLKVVREIPQMFIALSQAILDDHTAQTSLADFLGYDKPRRHQQRGSKRAAEELGMIPSDDKYRNPSNKDKSANPTTTTAAAAS